MTSSLSMSMSAYRCEECLAERGEVVRALVRMIPVSIVVDGEMIGDEWYCCPSCWKPKFEVKSRKMRSDDVSAKQRKSRPKLAVVAGTD